MLRLVTLSLALLALGVAGCGGDDSGSDSGGSSKAPTPRAAAPTPHAAKPKPKPKPKPQRDENGCFQVPQPKPKPDGGETKPSAPLTGNYTVTFKTNCGSFTVDIDEQVGGLSAASFVQFAKDGFYKGTFFHRIAPGFVIQGGDPTGTGQGGPGYTVQDKPPSDAQYPKYTVAMAKTPDEPPGTSGSQFFVMTGNSGLPPEYAIVGKVTKGTDVVDAIGKLGNAQQVPTQVVTIEKTSASGG